MLSMSFVPYQEETGTLIIPLEGYCQTASRLTASNSFAAQPWIYMLISLHVLHANLGRLPFAPRVRVHQTTSINARYKIQPMSKSSNTGNLKRKADDLGDSGFVAKTIDPAESNRPILDEESASAGPSNQQSNGGEGHPNLKKSKKEKPKWVGRRRGTRPDTDNVGEDSVERAPRLPKRMNALLIGYCGSGFNGMQM